MLKAMTMLVFDLSIERGRYSASLKDMGRQHLEQATPMVSLAAPGLGARSDHSTVKPAEQFAKGAAKAKPMQTMRIWEVSSHLGEANTASIRSNRSESGEPLASPPGSSTDVATTFANPFVKELKLNPCIANPGQMPGDARKSLQRPLDVYQAIDNDNRI